MIEIGVMGGTFNPPHERHLMVAQCALDQFALQKVMFVPTGMPPHKKVDVLDKETRFELVQLAVADNPCFEASRLEIDRPGTSWSIDTLRQLHEILGPDVHLNFIIGEDNLQAFASYDRRQEFFSLCRLIVCPRQSADAAHADEWEKLLPGAYMAILDCPASSMSSTLVRSWIRSGRSVRYLLPLPVHNLIIARGLYKNDPSYHA